VFYVVQSPARPAGESTGLSSVLYETRLSARRLVRLSAAHPGDYAIWKKVRTHRAAQVGHAVMLADGTLVPRGAA